MSYTPTEWETGNVVTAQKLNKLENGLASVASDADDLKSYLSDIENGGVHVFGASQIKNGTFNSSGGDVANAGRLRVIGYIKINAGDKINFTAGANTTQMLIGYFNNSKTYIDDSAWFTTKSSITATEGGYWILVFRKDASNSNIDRSEFDANVTLTRTTADAIVAEADKTLTLEDADFILRKVTSDGSTNESLTGSRIRVVYKLDKPFKYYIKNATYGAYAALYPTLSDAIYASSNYIDEIVSTYSREPLEGISFDTGYLLISLKKSDGSAITDAEKEAIENATTVYIEQIPIINDVTYEETIICEIANGTAYNPFNAFAVHSITLVEVSEFDKVFINTNKPLKTNGNYYSYGWCTYDKRMNRLRYVDHTYKTKSNTVAIQKGECYFQFNICEYDSNGNAVINRVSDFDGYTVSVTAKNIEGVTRNANLIKRMSLGSVALSTSALNSDMDDALVSISGFNTYVSGDGLSAVGKKKNLCFPVITDVHSSADALMRFIDYCNENQKYFDFCMGLGDFVARQPSEDTSWIDRIISKSEIPFLYTVGNHDSADTGLSGITQASARTKYFATIETKGWLDAENFIDSGKCSWVKDFSSYNIRVISLFEYGNADTIASDAPSSYCRRWMDSDLLQWFADTLYATPEGYSVIVLLHQIPNYPITFVENPFTVNEGVAQITSASFLNTIDGNPIEEIINAFKNSESISKTYNSIASYELGKTATVSKDFSGRTEDGKFIAYFTGHTHASFISKSQTYPDQLCVIVPTGSENIYQRKFGDMPYDTATRNKDNFYCVGIDADLKKINIVQIGGHTTVDMRERVFTSISY